MILAGGLGTRLRSVICDRPKVLAPVHGRPFLAFLLDQVAHAGITKVVLCTGYKAEQVEETFGRKFGGLDLTYSPEERPLGTAGALRLALPLVQSQAVVAMNGDSFCSVDMGAFWAWHCLHGHGASMVLREVQDTARYGRVSFAPDGQVRSFDEKQHGLGRGWINAGIYATSRQLLTEIPTDKPVSLERDVLPAWMARGLGGHQTQGQFIDIGLPNSYVQAEAFFVREQKNAA